MANNMSSRQACHAARYVVARVLRGLFWCLKYTVILPLATMALMALFVLWKDNTTPGKLLVKEINFVRQTAPAGQFPVSECWFSSSDSSGRSEIQDICHYRTNIIEHHFAGTIIMKEIVSVKKINGKTIEYRAIVVNGKIVCFAFGKTGSFKHEILKVHLMSTNRERAFRKQSEAWEEHRSISRSQNGFRIK